MRLLFVGPPGAGKGTQAERVAERLGIAHVSTGEMFRSLDESTELGRRVGEIMRAGDYVSDEIVIEMLEARIGEDDAAGGFILDGFPRTTGQAEALDHMLGSHGLDAVVLFEVDEEELVRRMLSRGRADDTEETIRTRFEVYREQTEPLIERYRDRGIVLEVEAVGAIEQITEGVISALGRHGLTVGS